MKLKKKILAEAEKLRTEAEEKKLNNDRLKLELGKEKIKLANEITEKFCSDFSEEEKLAYLMRLLSSIEVLISSPLEINNSEQTTGVSLKRQTDFKAET